MHLDAVVNGKVSNKHTKGINTSPKCQCQSATWMNDKKESVVVLTSHFDVWKLRLSHSHDVRRMVLPRGFE
jgi:hypothetical protein